MPFFYILRTARQMDYTKNNITFLKKLFFVIGLIFLLFAFWSIYWLVSVLHFGDLVAITKTEAGKEQDWQPQRTEKEYLPFEPDELKVFVPVERINAYVLQGIEGNIKTKYLHKTLQKTSRRFSKASFAKAGSNSAVNEAFRKNGDEVVKKHLVNTVMRLSDSLSVYSSFPEEINPLAFRRNIDEAVIIGNFFSAMAVRYVSIWNYDLSLASIGGAYLTAYYLERESENIPPSVLYCEYASLIRKSAFKKLIEILPNIKINPNRSTFTAENLLDWAVFFNKLQEKAMPLSYMVKGEKIIATSYLNENYAYRAGLGKNVVFKKICSPKIVEKYIDPIFELPMNIDDKSFPEAQRLLTEHWKRSEREPFTKLNILNNVLKHIFSPQELAAKTIISMRERNFMLANQNRVEDLRQTRGIVVALAVLAYYKKFPSLPSRLEKIEEWAGFKFPLDPATDRPFVYDSKNKDKVLSAPSGKNLQGGEYFPLDEIILLHIPEDS